MLTFYLSGVGAWFLILAAICVGFDPEPTWSRNVGMLGVCLVISAAWPLVVVIVLFGATWDWMKSV